MNPAIDSAFELAAVSFSAQLGGLDHIFDAAPIGLCVLDLDFRYVAVNAWFVRMYGLTRAHFIGRTVEQALPGPAAQIIVHLHRALAAGAAVEQEIALCNPSGASAQADCGELIYLRTAQPLFGPDGHPHAISVAVLDITQRRKMAQALEESQQHLRYTLELTPHIPWTSDAFGEITFISPRWNSITGTPVGPVTLQQWAAALHPEDVEAVKKQWIHSVRSGEPYDTEYRIQSATGGWRWVRARAYPRRSEAGKILQWYGTVEDVDDRKAISLQLAAANAELQRRALQDHLTGLANRRHFDAMLLCELKRATRIGLPTALIMLDIDHFKRYNDLAGHLAGDECLRLVAGEIARCIRRPPDLAARFGGEEFAIILPETPLEGALTIGHRVAAGVRHLVIEHPDPRVRHVTISVGIAVLPGSRLQQLPASPNDLIQAADQALYRAKANGRDRVESHTIPDQC